MSTVSVKSSAIMPVRDQSRIFTYVLAITWLVGVGMPILYSLISGNPAMGVPLLGVVFWFLLVRVARWLSPASQADSLMRRGRYAEVLALCDRALAVEGMGAWVGTRRLVWLNRRTTALISLGQEDTALLAALDALAVSADPETLGNCAMALLRLNRYDEAAAMGRLALSLTRERSVLCQGVLAMVFLAEGKPAEAEATASAGLGGFTSPVSIRTSGALYHLSRRDRPSHPRADTPLHTRRSACLLPQGRASRPTGDTLGSRDSEGTHSARDQPDTRLEQGRAKNTTVSSHGTARRG